MDYKLDLLMTNLELDNCNRLENKIIRNNEMHTQEFRNILEEEIKLLEKKKILINNMK
ncbi:hypothetical protein [Bacillus xiapuensis]|uniref:Fur-regulated basic protein FbpA n=1 Tax=Bacillus xiapuensis TaxID=2014075 RepID=A0ABU6N822_9BACI|nr:hypothetical protein [Bacillus xiapuensis]